MDCKILTDIESFYDLKEDWERLQEQDPDVTYYSTFEYNKAWLDSFEGKLDFNLSIICICIEGTVVGIAPFIIKNENKKIFSFNRLLFMGRGDSLNILVNRSINKPQKIVQEIINCVTNLKNIDHINLTHIKVFSIFANNILCDKKLNNHFQLLDEEPCIVKSKYKDFNSYVKDYYPKNFKKYRNKLKREQNYSFYFCDSYDRNLYELCEEIHIQEQISINKKLNIKSRSSLFQHRQAKLHHDLVLQNHDSGKCLIFYIKNDENNLIAYTRAYEYKGVIHSWNSGYNHKFLNYRPVHVLRYEIFNYFFNESSCLNFDFGAGRYHWKFRYTPDFDSVYSLDFFLDTKNANRLKRFKKMKQCINSVRALFKK